MPNVLAEYKPKPGGVIEDFHCDDTRIRGIRGPIRTGKTVGSVVEIPFRAHDQAPNRQGVRDTRCLVVRNTYGQLMDTTIKTFLKWIPNGVRGRFVQSPYPNFYYQLGDTRCEIWFRALDRDDHLRNLLSMEYTFFYLNEARELKREFIDWLESRAGQYPPRIDMPAGHKGPWPTWYGGWMDTNPPEDNIPGDPHWWYHLFEEQCQPGHDDYDPKLAAKYRQFVVDKTENAHNLPGGIDYYEELAIGKPKEWCRVYIGGEYGFIIGGKPVYKDAWNDGWHVRQDNYEPVRGLPIYRGWDIGNTFHPALVFGQLNQGLEVFDEAVFQDIGIHALKEASIEYCARYYPDFEFVDHGDPAMLSRAAGDKEERTCQAIFAAEPHPISINPAEVTFKGRRTAVERLLARTVNMGIGEPVLPYFRLSPRCKVLRTGFNGRYQYPEIGTTGEFREEPIKNMYADAHDALQYMATGIFSPIEDKDPERATKRARAPRPPSPMAV